MQSEIEMATNLNNAIRHGNKPKILHESDLYVNSCPNILSAIGQHLEVEKKIEMLFDENNNTILTRPLNPRFFYNLRPSSNCGHRAFSSDSSLGRN